MHKIKIGEFRYLVVAIYREEQGNWTSVFCDSDAEASRWIESQYTDKKEQPTSVIVYRDLNTVLNAMIKNKNNVQGWTLYELYLSQYPDDDQKKKVIEFWNKEK